MPHLDKVSHVVVVHDVIHVSVFQGSTVDTRLGVETLGGGQELADLVHILLICRWLYCHALRVLIVWAQHLRGSGSSDTLAIRLLWGGADNG